VPDINWIFSHAGGTAPFLVERFTRLPTLSNRADPNRAKLTAEDVLGELKRFYYDTAQAAHPHALSSLMQMVSVSQVLYGTDFPFRTSADHVKGLAAFFKPDDLKAVERENAVRLLPRLRTA
jgi:6-methylsalicylate decarboxylase